jgi:hypothetical protein
VEPDEGRRLSQYIGDDDDDFQPPRQRKTVTPNKKTPEKEPPNKKTPQKEQPKNKTPQKEPPKKPLEKRKMLSPKSKEWISDEDSDHESDDSKCGRKEKMERNKGRFEGLGNEYMNRAFAEDGNYEEVENKGDENEEGGGSDYDGDQEEEEEVQGEGEGDDEGLGEENLEENGEE